MALWPDFSIDANRTFNPTGIGWVESIPIFLLGGFVGMGCCVLNLGLGIVAGAVGLTTLIVTLTTIRPIRPGLVMLTAGVFAAFLLYGLLAIYWMVNGTS